MIKKYAIIGSGIAGLSAAKAIREKDQTGSIDIFTAENNLPYSRPMLTKAPFASFNTDDWTIYPEKWFEDNRITLHMDEEALSIDETAKTVVSAKGEYAFDKLIIASGAEGFIPPIPGRDKANVFTIRRSQDIFDIKKAFRASAKAVVIGGGVIGLEAAAELYRYGADVTVLEALPYLMTKQIDREISDVICKVLKNIKIYTDVKIESIEGGEKAERVLLNDGRSFPCDLIVAACGVKPVLGFINGTAIKQERGIVIDQYCQTSVADIYAAGDCAQYDGMNYALWSQAMAQGEAAGLNAAGIHQPTADFDTSLVINSPYLSLFALGDMGKNPKAEYTVKRENLDGDDGLFFVNPKQGHFFKKIYYSEGRPVGAAIVGNLSGMQELKDEINSPEVSK